MTRTHNYKKYYKGRHRTQKDRRRSALLNKRKSQKGGNKRSLLTKGLSSLAQNQHIHTAVAAGVDSVFNDVGSNNSSKENSTHSMGDSSKLLSEMKQLEDRIDKNINTKGIEIQSKLDKTLTELKKTKHDAMQEHIEKDPQYTEILNEKKAKAQKTQKAIEYEVGIQERKVMGGLVELPTPKGGKNTAFFKLINVSQPNRFAGMLNNLNISLSYVSIKGALRKELLKKVLNPDNYYFKVAFDHQAPTELKGKNIIVSSRNAIIDPKRAKEFQKFLMPKNRGGKSFCIVVGHAADDPIGKGVLVYRLPHMGFIDCDGKRLILMTESSKTMEYDITNNPSYRYIGLIESKGHSELYTMMNSLKKLHDGNEANAFEELRVEYLKELSDPSSQIQKIVKFHLEHTLKKGNKEKKNMMKYLYSLVHLDTCPSIDEAYDKLDPGKSAVFDDKKLSEMVRLLDEAVEKTKGRANSIKDKSNLEDIIIIGLGRATSAAETSKTGGGAGQDRSRKMRGGLGGGYAASFAQQPPAKPASVPPDEVTQKKANLSESIHYGDEYSIDIIKEIYKKLIKKKPTKDEVVKQKQQLEKASEYLVEQLTKKLKDLSHKDDKFGTKVKQAERNENAGKNDGNITDRELEEQKASNDAAGHGEHSDAQLDEQRKKNKEEEGNGYITTSELEKQKANNAAVGHGEYSDAQLDQQRKKNKEEEGNGYITTSELEKQKANNAAVGHGEYSDAQLDQQRNKNKEAGHGYITTSELEKQKASNAAAGHREYSDAQLDRQRNENHAAGLGHITDSKVASERNANKDKLGYYTNEQLKTQRAENKEVGRGHITHKEVENERNKNNDYGYGEYNNEELRRQRSRNVESGLGHIVDAQRKANASKVFGTAAGSVANSMADSAKAMSRAATRIADGVANSTTIPAKAQRKMKMDGGDQVPSKMTEEDKVVKVVDYFKDFIPYIHSGRVSKKPEIRKLIFELIYIVNALYRVGVRIELINKFTTAEETEKKKIIEEMSVSTGVISRMRSYLPSLPSLKGIKRTTELTDADLKTL